MTPKTSNWLTGGRVHHRLADRIRAQISAGEYPPGSALPSESALAAYYRLARSTVRRSLAVLADEDLIITLPGKGRVVTGPEGEPRAAYRYQAIANELRAQIGTGTLATGAKLPSELALCKQYGASRNTVRQALDELKDEGLIMSRHGRGHFVQTVRD
ncbi:GntR family transcriptional regulator [Streptosporangium sp. NPDC006930]|uniref:GntR family transcriptional regulator n=1 Tax=Streptosporangium sp. NPDC006930 TaxID=3154783 RepID=UPI003413077B